MHSRFLSVARHINLGDTDIFKTVPSARPAHSSISYPDYYLAARIVISWIIYAYIDWEKRHIHKSFGFIYIIMLNNSLYKTIKIQFTPNAVMIQ